MTMKTINIKNKWNTFASSGVLIFTVAATFMLTPPLLSLSEETKINWFAKFLITALIALFAVPMLVRSQKKDYKFWYRLAIAGLVLTLLSVATYTFLCDKWSVPFYSHDRLVIGQTMYEEVKPTADDYIKNYRGNYGPIEAFVKARQGATANIWPLEELQHRYDILNTLYIFTFIVVALFIISIIQSLYCYERGTLGL